MQEGFYCYTVIFESICVWLLGRLFGGLLMSFFLRYYLKQLVLVMRNAKLTMVTMTLLFGLCFYLRMFEGDIREIPLCIVLGFAASELMRLLIVAIIVIADYKVTKVFNAEGFSDSYLRLYEKENIIGKPYKEYSAVVFAEIMVRSGHVKEAMQYFEIITVSPDNKFMYRALIYLRMLAALKAGDPKLADSIWNQERHYIAHSADKPARSVDKALLLLMTIYADCANGRYERALQQTVTYLQSKEFKRYKTAEFDFRIVHLFILKKLGREAFNNIAPAVKYDIETKSHLYDWEMEQYLIDFNKAVNGVFPWQ